jgi:hypothetical protein
VPQAVSRKRTRHGQVQHADIDLALLEQMIGHRFGGRYHAPLSDDQVVGVFDPVGIHTPIAASGKPGIFLQGEFGKLGHVRQIIGSLSRHTQSVGIVPLRCPGHGGRINTPQLGNAPTPGSEQQALGRCWGFDQVVRSTQVFHDQLGLGPQ